MFFFCSPFIPSIFNSNSQFYLRRFYNYFIIPEKSTEDSNAMQMIRAGLKSVIIKPEIPAKAVSAGSPDFQQYKLYTFQTMLNRMKQLMRESEELPDVNSKSYNFFIFLELNILYLLSYWLSFAKIRWHNCQSHHCVYCESSEKG